MASGPLQAACPPISPSIDVDRSVTVFLNRTTWKHLGCVAALTALSALGGGAIAHHVSGDDHSGVALSMDPQAEVSPPATGIKAMYPTREEAAAAAVHFGCKGAHQMGDQWMPCSAHNHGSHTSH